METSEPSLRTSTTFAIGASYHPVGARNEGGFTRGTTIIDCCRWLSASGFVRPITMKIAQSALPAPEAVSVEVSPLPDLEEFRAAFTGREAEVEAFLRHRKQLKEGQAWPEAGQYLVERVAGKLPAFLEAVEKFNAKGAQA